MAFKYSRIVMAPALSAGGSSVWLPSWPGENQARQRFAQILGFSFWTSVWRPLSPDQKSQCRDTPMPRSLKRTAAFTHLQQRFHIRFHLSSCTRAQSSSISARCLWSSRSTHAAIMSKPVCSINRLVQLLNGVSVFGTT
jgi:hypothetical protein